MFTDAPEMEDHEDGNNTFLQNDGEHLSGYKTSHLSQRRAIS
jgi:hypothetical protein